METQQLRGYFCRAKEGVAPVNYIDKPGPKLEYYIAQEIEIEDMSEFLGILKSTTKVDELCQQYGELCQNGGFPYGCIRISHGGLKLILFAGKNLKPLYVKYVGPNIWSGDGTID